MGLLCDQLPMFTHDGYENYASFLIKQRVYPLCKTFVDRDFRVISQHILLHCPNIANLVPRKAPTPLIGFRWTVAYERVARDLLLPVDSNVKKKSSFIQLSVLKMENGTF